MPYDPTDPLDTPWQALLRDEFAIVEWKRRYRRSPEEVERLQREEAHERDVADAMVRILSAAEPYGLVDLTLWQAATSVCVWKVPIEAPRWARVVRRWEAKHQPAEPSLYGIPYGIPSEDDPLTFRPGVYFGLSREDHRAMYEDGRPKP
jgi:hypothetical protein